MPHRLWRWVGSAASAPHRRSRLFCLVGRMKRGFPDTGLSVLFGVGAAYSRNMGVSDRCDLAVWPRAAGRYCGGALLAGLPHFRGETHQKALRLLTSPEGDEVVAWSLRK